MAHGRVKEIPTARVLSLAVDALVARKARRDVHRYAEEAFRIALVDAPARAWEIAIMFRLSPVWRAHVEERLRRMKVLSGDDEHERAYRFRIAERVARELTELGVGDYTFCRSCGAFISPESTPQLSKTDIVCHACASSSEATPLACATCERPFDGATPIQLVNGARVCMRCSIMAIPVVTCSVCKQEFSGRGMRFGQKLLCCPCTADERRQSTGRS